MKRPTPRRQSHLALLVSMAAALAIQTAVAGVFIPPGLKPGDTYHLVFTTRDSIDGTSSDINDYNNFAQAQAALASSVTGTDEGVTWKAIGSTPTVDAIDNAPVSGPVFLLDGTKIADDQDDLWDGSIDAPINLDQFLSTPADTGLNSVYTGTTTSGVASALPFSTNDDVTVGQWNFSNSQWVASFGWGPYTTPHHIYAISCPIVVPYPVLVYDCDTCGTFKYSQVHTEVDGFKNGDQLCLYGSGLTSKFKLKALLVQQDNCFVRLVYGECVGYDGKRRKAYWFESDGGHSYPDFCEPYYDCPKLVDSVCDGIVMKKSVPSRQIEMSGYDFGKQFYRNIFEADDNSYQDPSVLEVLGYDYGGAMTNCRFTASFPPTQKPFNYLNFVEPDRGEVEEIPLKRENRMDYLCAPKSLCGPFFTYCLSRGGWTTEYPGLFAIRVNPDLSLECQGDSARDDGWVPGYDFACIYACVKYRLNTMLTANANLLDPVYGNGGYSATEAFTNSPSPDPERAESSNYCTLNPRTLEYGVLMAALYLESKGYEFNFYDVQCAVNQAFGLPGEQP